MCAIVHVYYMAKILLTKLGTQVFGCLYLCYRPIKQEITGFLSHPVYWFLNRAFVLRCCTYSRIFFCLTIYLYGIPIIRDILVSGSRNALIFHWFGVWTQSFLQKARPKWLKYQTETCLYVIFQNTFQNSLAACVCIYHRHSELFCIQVAGLYPGSSRDSSFWLARFQIVAN